MWSVFHCHSDISWLGWLPQCMLDEWRLNTTHSKCGGGLWDTIMHYMFSKTKQNKTSKQKIRVVLHYNVPKAWTATLSTSRQWKWLSRYRNCFETICSSQEEFMLSQYIIIKQQTTVVNNYSVPAFNNTFLCDFIIMRTVAVNAPLLTFFIYSGGWLAHFDDAWEAYKIQLPGCCLPLNPGC